MKINKFDEKNVHEAFRRGAGVKVTPAAIYLRFKNVIFCNFFIFRFLETQNFSNEFPLMIYMRLPINFLSLLPM